MSTDKSRGEVHITNDIGSAPGQEHRGVEAVHTRRWVNLDDDPQNGAAPGDLHKRREHGRVDKALQGRFVS